MSAPGFFDDLKASLGVTAVEDDEEGWKGPAVEVFLLRAAAAVGGLIALGVTEKAFSSAHSPHETIEVIES